MSVKKYYHIDYGVKQKNKFRNITIVTVALAFVAIGIYKSNLLPLNSLITTKNSSLQATIDRDYAKVNDAQFESSIPWGNNQFAAYSVPKDSFVKTSRPTEKQVPIASLAKVITVLAILKEKPLEPGQQGPEITITDKDVALLSQYAQKGGTTVPVEAGEKISEYQAIQAILMVSSNNMADSLAIWAFGSMDNYTKYANSMLKEMGLKNTIVADDASGFSPKTVSTASDMTKIGYLYMENPILKEIALQKNAKVPVAGKIPNHNDFFNENGMVGIKFGNTDEAGKCFLAASIRTTESGEEEVAVTAVLGSSDYDVAAKDAEAILKAGNKNHDYLIKNP